MQLLTPDQFAEWIAFTRLRGPLGTGRADTYALMNMDYAAGSRDPATSRLWWLKQPVDEEATGEMYVPTAEERAWVAAMAD